MTKIIKQFYLEPEQVKQLEEESKRTGAPQAEIMRRALEAYFSKK